MRFVRYLFAGLKDVDPENPRPSGHYQVDRNADWYYVDDDLEITLGDAEADIVDE